MIGGLVVVCVAGLVGANEPPPPPPPLAPAALTTREDTELTATLTAPPGARLKLRKAPRRGTATLDEATAQLRYVPNKDVHGDDDIVIEVTVDGRRSEQKLTITVTPVNDAPVVDALSLGTKEETATGYRLTAKDVDGDPLRFAIGEPPANGTATVDGKGNVVFTPDKDVVGESRFTVVVDDGHGGEAVAVVTVKIGNVNDAPTIGATSLSGNEDEASTGSAVGADVDGDKLTYALGTAPKNGTATVEASGRLRYQPKADHNGTDRFTVVVKDPAGLTATGTVDVAIAAVNDAPTASPLELTTAEDVAVEGAVVARDVDGDALTYSVDATPDGTATIDAKGRLKLVPRRDFNGVVALTVSVADGHGGTITAPVKGKVTPVNDPPTLTGAKLETAEDVVGRVTLVAADVDGDKLTWAVTTAPKHGTAMIDARGGLTFTPTKDFNGTDSVVVTVTDAAGASAKATVEIDVAPVNDPPTGAAVRATTREDTAVSVKVVASDVDGDKLAYAIEPGSDVARIDANGLLTWTPKPDTFTKADGERVVVRVTDGRGGSVEIPVVVVVTAVNDRPTIGSVGFSGDEDQVLTAKIEAADVDGDKLRFALFTPPKTGRATIGANGELRYTPPRDWHGKDVLTVEVDDGQAFARQNIAITITPVNDAPTTRPLALTTDEDRTVKGTVVGSDVDGDKLTFSVRDAPGHGDAVVDAGNGRLTFKPAADWHGKDVLTVAVSDGSLEAVAVVDVVVAAVPDAPVTFAQPLAVVEDTPVEGALPAREPDGERLTFALTSESKLGTITLLDKRSGRVRYVPRPDVNGKDRVTFTATDNITVVDGVLDVEIAAVNDAPLATGASARTREDTPVEVVIAMTDVDNDQPVVEVVGDVVGARVDVVDGRRGRLRITPAADKHDTIRFKVRAKEALASAPVDVVVEVEAVNDAPVITGGRFSTVEDTALSATLKSSDVDGDVLAFRVGRAPARGNVVVEKKTGAFVYTPKENASGKDGFTIVVEDPAGLQASAAVEVDVSAVDDAPIALEGRLRSPRAGRVTGTLVGRDPEGARLRFVIGQQPSLGRVELLDERTGSYAYTPEGGQRSGRTSFTFFVEADGQKSVAATVLIDVD